MTQAPPASLLDRLAAHGQRIEAPAGAHLFEPGKACEGFVIVEAGHVRVQLAGLSGREVLLYTVGPGETCILTTACLLGGSDYAAAGIADGAVELIYVPRAAFDALIARDAEFRHFVFESFGRRLGDLMHTIEAVAFERIGPRLAKLLTARADDDGILAATHQSLAADLGTAREVVSRNLKEFERRGWLEIERGRIKLRSRDDLSGFAAGAV